MRYRREWFNEELPLARYAHEKVGEPFRNDSGVRTALSTFRPQEAGEFAPFTVWKAENGQMVVDQEMTAQAQKFAPVSEFKDKDNTLSPNLRFHGDTVIVEKKGFGFKVAQPSSRVLNLYQNGVSSEENASAYRKPRAKVYFTWE